MFNGSNLTITGRDRFALLRGPLHIESHFKQPPLPLRQFDDVELHAGRLEAEHAVRVRR